MKGINKKDFSMRSFQFAKDMLSVNGGEIPVDSAFVASKIGCKVVSTNLQPQIFYAVFRNGFDGATIVINKNDSKQRQRLACASAIARYKLMTLNDDENCETSYVAMRDGDTNSFVCDFALEFLIPKGSLTYKNDDNGVPAALLEAVKFGVPVELMAKRLNQL